MEIGDSVYQLELSLHHGHHIHSLNTNGFLPHGAVAVVTTLEGVEWLRDLVDRLWLFKVGDSGSRKPPYRGMPLIILALDKGMDITDIAVDPAGFCTGLLHSMLG